MNIQFIFNIHVCFKCHDLEKTFFPLCLHQGVLCFDLFVTLTSWLSEFFFFLNQKKMRITDDCSTVWWDKASDEWRCCLPTEITVWFVIELFLLKYEVSEQVRVCGWSVRGKLYLESCDTDTLKLRQQSVRLNDPGTRFPPQTSETHTQC